MNAEIKSKWVAALRSGEYKQTTGQLRDDKGYCCLGVLCDLHSKECGGRWVGFRYDEERMVVPSVVQYWAGVSDSPTVDRGDDDGEEDLSVLNDNGLSFTQIADLIEAQL